MRRQTVQAKPVGPGSNLFYLVLFIVNLVSMPPDALAAPTEVRPNVVIVLTDEEMRPIGDRDQCAWNQAHVAAGMPAFGYAEIEVARPGEYRFELRRWPREIEAPMADVPSWSRA